jgi:hypothetical protein
MNYSKLPAPVLAKLVALEESIEDLSERVARAEYGITAARSRLTGTFQKQSEYDALMASLKQLVADKPVLEQKLHTAQRTLSAGKAWIDRLPPNTTLEVVEAKTDGHDLDAVGDRLKAAQDELKTLRAAPTPSVDIEERIKRHVAEVARPKISGIGEGHTLEVIWPYNNIVSMMALLLGDGMAEVLMAEVTRMANDPMPPAARKQRIGELEAEIDTMQRQAFGLGADASDLPPAVVLGVRVVRPEQVKRSERRERAA